jgi:hypothetical protein
METYLLPVRTLMDVHNLATAAENIQKNLFQLGINTKGSPSEGTTIEKPGGPYRRYTAHQIEKLFDIVIEEDKLPKKRHFSVLSTSKQLNAISRNIRMTRKDAYLSALGNLATGRKARLTEAHSQC